MFNTKLIYDIYVQSKDNGKYLPFQRDHKFNLYYMDICEANVEEHCCFNTVKKGKRLFLILDQKSVEAVRNLHKRCPLTSDKDFVNLLQCNSI